MTNKKRYIIAGFVLPVVESDNKQNARVRKKRQFSASIPVERTGRRPDENVSSGPINVNNFLPSNRKEARTFPALKSERFQMVFNV